VSDVPDLPGGAGEQRELGARLRAVVEAKDAEVAVLRAELAAERELRRRLELQVAELQRRLGMDSTDSGTPPSKEPIGARERRKAERKARQSSEREWREDRLCNTFSGIRRAARRPVRGPLVIVLLIVSFSAPRRRLPRCML
jgi:hypothetical protein